MNMAKALVLYYNCLIENKYRQRQQNPIV